MIDFHDQIPSLFQHLQVPDGTERESRATLYDNDPAENRDIETRNCGYLPHWPEPQDEAAEHSYDNTFYIKPRQFLSVNSFPQQQTLAEVSPESIDSLPDDDGLPDEDLEADGPTRLLHFIQTVTLELQSRFARNKGSDDYCDVYKTKFESVLSGRELYYADLLALASNSDFPAVTTCKGSTSSHTIVVEGTSGSATCTMPHKGHYLEAAGLGPFEQLFYCDSQWRVSDSLYNLPWESRKLPSSFWQEPRRCHHHQIDDHMALELPTVCPDFADLFDQ